MQEKRSHLWDRHEDNWYVEPEWCSRRLFDVESFEGGIVDPSAGGGNIINSAKAAGIEAYGYDLRDRGHPGVLSGRNFITGEGYIHGSWPTPNIVSNPPYGKGEGKERLEEQFLRLSLERARNKVALFLDASWANASKRGAWLETLPLYRVYKVGPRPACPPGDFIRAGGKVGNGTKDYSWFVFLKGFQGSPTLHWMRRDD